MSVLESKIEINLGEIHLKVQNEVFEFVKKELPPDCILQAENGVLVAHKIILSAASQHFKEIFTSNANLGLMKVFIPEVKLPDLAALVNLIYNGKVEIQPQQLSGFQKIAHTLKIPLHKITALPFPHHETILITQGRQFPKTEQEKIRDEKKTVEVVKTNEHQQQQNNEKVSGGDQEKLTQRSDTGKESDMQEPKMETNNTETAQKLSQEDEKKEEKVAVELSKSEHCPPENSNSKRPKRVRKKTYKVSEGISLKSPSRGRAPYNRKLTGKRIKCTEPDDNQFRCEFCSKVFKNSSKRHIVECSYNPDRVIAHCPICQAVVKPSGLTSHKKWHHR